MFRFNKGQWSAAILACVVSVPAIGFDLGGLKALGEKLQQNLEQQQGGGDNSTPKPSANRPVTSQSDNRGNVATICEKPEFGFGGVMADQYSVGDPESLVKKYFNIDSTIAEQQIREHLFTSMHPVIGAPFVEAIHDGGLYSGEARSRGIELIKDPSIFKLAQVIAAAEQGGGSSGGFGGGSSKLENIEAKAVFAMVALELEPLLKDRGVVPSMLKDARKPGSFAGVQKSLISPMAFALSARYGYFVEGNFQKFDNFLTRSRERVTFDGGSNTAKLSDARGGCRICTRTHNYAADQGLGGGKFAQQRAQGEQVLADMNQNKARFNPPGWEQGYEKAAAEASRLNAVVGDIFQQAKTQSRSEAAGAEAARRSAEAQAKYGMTANPAVAEATEFLMMDAPQIADANKQAALKTATEDRYRNLDRLRKLQAPVMSAMVSMDYDLRDLKDKSDRVYNLVLSSCLVSVAQQRAHAASDVPLPDPEDNKAEEDFMRM